MIVKHALRSLRRTPAFTIAVILTLVLVFPQGVAGFVSERINARRRVAAA